MADPYSSSLCSTPDLEAAPLSGSVVGRGRTAEPTKVQGSQTPGSCVSINVSPADELRVGDDVDGFDSRLNHRSKVMIIARCHKTMIHVDVVRSARSGIEEIRERDEGA